MNFQLQRAPFRFLPLFAFAFFLGGCLNQTASTTEKTYFLKASALAADGYGFKAFSKHEKFSKTRFADGSIDLDYEFETPDSEANWPLYFQETLSTTPSRADAVTGIATTRGATMLMLKNQSLKEKPVAGETIYGDGSKLTLLTLNGQPAGNIFSARKGKRTFWLVMSGWYFETPAEWDAFAGTKVRAWLDGEK